MEARYSTCPVNGDRRSLKDERRLNITKEQHDADTCHPGLGLALVKNLVELHDGLVSCFSEGSDWGNYFTAVLPRVAEPDRRDRQAMAQQLDSETVKKLQILVVDDNVDAAQMLKMLLETCGHDVFVAHEALTAL